MKAWNYFFGAVVGMMSFHTLGMYMDWWEKPSLSPFSIWEAFMIGAVISGIANHPPIFSKFKYVIGLGVGLAYGLQVPWWVLRAVFGLESFDGVRWIARTIVAVCVILGGVYHLPIIPPKVKGAITGAAAPLVLLFFCLLFLFPGIGMIFGESAALAAYDMIPEGRRGTEVFLVLLMALGAWIGANYHEHNEETEQARKAG